MNHLPWARRVIWALPFVLLGLAGNSSAGEPPSGPDAARQLRRTPLVELIEKVSPSVVDIVLIKPGDGKPTLVTGSGSVLHESGYLVTNDHVVRDSLQTLVLLDDGEQIPPNVLFRTVESENQPEKPEHAELEKEDPPIQPEH